VPPLAVTTAVPSQTALQLTLVAVADAVSGKGSVITTDRTMVHPFASVTVHVYVPAQRPAAAAPVPPDGAQAKVYGRVPPPALIAAVPLHAPLQETFVWVVAAESAEGSVISDVLSAVQPFASVTVQVYVPGHNPVAEAPDPPEGDHR